MRLIISAILGFFVVAALAETATPTPTPVVNAPASSNFQVPPKDIYIFKDVRGPTDKTVIPNVQPTSFTSYSQGSDSRLAILLTETNSDWLGLAHGLKSIGVPFVITRDYHQALRHKVVYVYPNLSGKSLSADALRALSNFPRQGGTLIAQNVLDHNLDASFGFQQAVPTKETEIHFNINIPIAADFTEPEEKSIKVATKIGQDAGRYQYYAYLQTADTPLATYENGTAAITQKNYSTGRAYAFGLDVGRFLLNGYNGVEGNNGEDNVAIYYVDHFEPTSDVLLRTVKNIYLQGQSNGITLAAVPNGKPLAVMLTHDICFSIALKNIPDYANFEHDHGIKATYFIQTKYIHDWMDIIFFNEDAIKIYKKLQAMGMEIASHSVSHSLQFNTYPLGTGEEYYPAYTPYVKDKTTTYNGSILGDLRVSRFLLQHFLPPEQVLAFRPGYLRCPNALPQALLATGFQYSSSVTANDSSTHLPFQVNYNRGTTSELPIYEFPVTVEDQADPPMLHRLPEAVAIAKKISRYGGIFVILIHPDVTGQKLEFEQGFVKALGSDAWYGTVSEFGAWWAARDKVGIDVVTHADSEIVSISAPVAISGLSLKLPAGLTYVSSEPADLKVMQQGQEVIIDHVMGQAKLFFKKK